MAQIFRPGANSIARIVLVVLACAPFLAIAACYALALSPYITGQGIVVTQPVPFSHEHHVGGLGIDCRYCHAGVETSSVAGVPPTETCMTCHSQIWTNAGMLEPVRRSFATGEPIHWRRVHQLPDYVYFNHSIHIAKGIGCTTCHGEVEHMPLMRQAEPLTMGWCLHCHRDPAPNLRERQYLFATDWKPPPGQFARDLQLMKEYGVRTVGLTDCSTCHR